VGRIQINDYTSKDNVQLCDLSGMPDLCTGCSHTQSQISSYLSNAVSMGVQGKPLLLLGFAGLNVSAGFRIDAAKHQDAAELGTILNTLPSSVYTFQVLGCSMSLAIKRIFGRK
jgi:alpha-amylase